MSVPEEGQKFVTRLDQSESAWRVASDEHGLRFWSEQTESGSDDTVEASGPAGGRAEWASLGHGRFLIRIDGKPVVARVVRTSPHEYSIETGGRQFVIAAEDEVSARAARQQRAAQAGKTGPLAVPAPMPGTVVQVLVEDGDTVTEGQPILIIEAMKMQNELASPAAGVVHGLSVEPGQAVDARQKLCDVIR